MQAAQLFDEATEKLDIDEDDLLSAQLGLDKDSEKFKVRGTRITPDPAAVASTSKPSPLPPHAPLGVQEQDQAQIEGAGRGAEGRSAAGAGAPPRSARFCLCPGGVGWPLMSAIFCNRPATGPV